MAEPQTVGQRIKKAREGRYIRSARELARLVTEHGVSISPQALSRIEAGANPRPALLTAIAEVLDIPEDELRHGPRDGEAFFVSQIKSLQDDLDQYQRDRLVWLAQDMAAETRARRASMVTDLNADEAALIAAYRAQSAAAQRAIYATPRICWRLVRGSNPSLLLDRELSDPADSRAMQPILQWGLGSGQR